MKILMHALHAVLVLSLLSVSPVSQAEPRHSSSTSSSKSFKGGFSSQRSSSPAPRAPRQEAGASSARGGFGAFNSAPARSAQKSDSVLSQRLDRQASEANALRTLDARRASQEQAARDTRPVPGYEGRQNNGQGNGQNNAQYGNQYNTPGPAPAPAPAPAQRADSGLTGVVAGMVLGQMANGAHARNNNGYPGTGAAVNAGTSSASVNQAGGGTSFFGGVVRMFMWLVALSALAWLAYFLIQRKRRRAAENRPNYTFEGQ